MDFLPEPVIQGRLFNAFRHGVLDHPALAATSGGRDLLLEEHALTCLYWFAGEDPFGVDLLHRRDEVLPTKLTRNKYLKSYATWGRRLNQARIEGLAVPVRKKDYIIPNSGVNAPKYHYPTLALEFISHRYRPIRVGISGSHVQDIPVGPFPAKISKASIRVRESACLLGIFLESSLQDPLLENYTLFLERAFFALLGFNPVVRLGLRQPFGNFARESVASLAGYLYLHEAQLRAAFPFFSTYYDQLLECMGELTNLLTCVGVYYPEDYV
jgi:hypothetical protein